MEEPLDVRDTASADADAAHAHCDMAAPVTAVLQAAAALPHPQQLAQRAQTQARLWAGAFTFTLELGRYEVCACVQRGGGVERVGAGAGYVRWRLPAHCLGFTGFPAAPPRPHPRLYRTATRTAVPQEAYMLMLSINAADAQLDCLGALVARLCSGVPRGVQLLCRLPWAHNMLVRSSGAGGEGCWCWWLMRRGCVHAALHPDSAAIISCLPAPPLTTRCLPPTCPPAPCPPPPSACLQPVRGGGGGSGGGHKQATWVAMVDEVVGVLQRRADHLDLRAAPQPYKVGAGGV